MDHPTPPPTIAPNVFILADHTKAALACDIAKALEKLDPDLVTWWFHEPIFDALASLIGEFSFGTYFGDVRTHGYSDALVSLTEWAKDQFGPDHLANMALKELLEARDYGNSETVVFPDASWAYVQPLLPHLKPHEVLIVDLTAGQIGMPTDLYKPFARQHLIFASPTVENVVAAILEASK